ncbi:MAG: exodeoxyribonuclease V subunit gamma [Pyrinomonadaceae bacterium]|nr:exodeoxyribonuclease V subunit gamma [Pyrinomonadaceae bacterium]
MSKVSESRIDVFSDAGRRVQVAREWIQAYSPDTEVLVLAHSAEAASDLQMSVVNSTGSWFGMKRFTLNVLAARLAQHALADSGRAPASNLSFTAVVARAIHSLQSEGKLSYFEPVATRPGFPVAVARTLEELRMNEVDVDSIARLERGGKDLAAIANLVEQQLQESKLNDRAALFRAAIDSINSPENTPYVGLPILFLDVATRSRLETRLIQELAAPSPRVLATMPKGDERTIAAFEAALGCKRNHAAGDHDASSTSLSFAKQHLFENSAPPVTPLDASVTIQNWPGEPRECVEIVRSIQAQAAEGVPFDQMAVLLNSPGEYRSHLEEAFSRAEIPAYFVRGTTAPDPAGRAMLALLACAADGLSAKRFAEYLSLGQVPAPEANKDVESKWVAPNDELIAGATEAESEAVTELVGSSAVAKPEDAAVVDGALRAPARWERLLVDSAVIGGKERWIRRLEGLANEFRLRMEEAAPEDEARVGSIRKQIRDLDALQEYALPLIERLADLPARANWDEWLAHLRELAVNALRQPEGVMATLAELDPMSSVGPVDLYEVQLVLEARLHDLGVEPPKRRYGRVFIGPVDAARGLSFRSVFIPGLAERIFPRKIVEDPILPDVQRKDTELTTRRDQLEAERLALRIAVGAARERVYLSYPRIDVQQSRPRVPSFYALEALRAAEGKLPGFEEIASRAESTTRARLGWPAPKRPEAAIDEAEYDLALLANLVESSKEEATGAAHYLLTANTHLARALRARSRRWLRRWTPNDGLVDVDDLGRQSLAKHQFSARSFSATALQNYASCPYRFFLSAILRLDLRQEPAAIEAIDPLTRGSLFHETQFEVLTKLKAAGLLPLETGSLGKAFDLVDQELGRLAGDYEDRLAPAIPRVWQDGINSIRVDLREWLRRMADSDEGWIPDKFELSFGLSDRGPRESDPASVDDPVAIIGDLKLRGSIDMVERQGDRYRVTDHKTGKARAPKDTIVGGGRYLQPLLYALACQELLDGHVESGRLYYCTADGGYEERIVPLDEDNLPILNSVLIAIRQALADAFLPAAPDKDACTWCDFLAVCGAFEEKRTSMKPRDRLVQIKALRGLP